MKNRLKVCKDIRIIVDKFFAHTADPDTIYLSSEQMEITLGSIKNCIRAIFQVKNQITEILFSSYSAGVPYIEYGSWDNISKKWIESDTQAKELWDKACKEMNSWLNAPLSTDD